MKCVFCGGKVKKAKVTFEHEIRGRVILVTNVPAEVCGACGEKTYSPDVTDRLLLFAKHKYTPVRIVKVPVFNYAKTA
ncbi:MAG: type II toxin-antitoxin system MqsA family antitoxin [Candidatus Sumerlaeota bacterium]|nr:type II toxin-antitoxin system MqsA family antitoxin [Candidatus Sumerlaeota bacterium]